jgi:hypothetical protein
MEFRGAINDEIDAYDGAKIYLNKSLELKNKPKNKRKLIEAIWSPKNDDGNIYASWKIESKIPYYPFNVMDEDELYCVGMVFSIDELNN